MEFKIPQFPDNWNESLGLKLDIAAASANRTDWKSAKRKRLQEKKGNFLHYGIGGKGVDHRYFRTVAPLTRPYIAAGSDASQSYQHKNKHNRSSSRPSKHRKSHHHHRKHHHHKEKYVPGGSSPDSVLFFDSKYPGSKGLLSGDRQGYQLPGADRGSLVPTRCSRHSRDCPGLRRQGRRRPAGVPLQPHHLLPVLPQVVPGRYGVLQIHPQRGASHGVLTGARGQRRCKYDLGNASSHPIHHFISLYSCRFSFDVGLVFHLTELTNYNHGRRSI